MNNKPVELLEKYPEETQALKFYEEYIKSGKFIPISTEEILWSKIGLAGQVDLIVKDTRPETLDKIYIIDYKTCKQLRLSSDYKKKMLDDFNHLDDCEFNHYSLQLSLYKMLYGNPVEKLLIVHITPDEYKLYDALDLECTEEKVKKWL